MEYPQASTIFCIITDAVHPTRIYLFGSRDADVEDGLTHIGTIND